MAAESPARLAELVEELSGAPGAAAVELNLAWPGLPIEEAEAPDRIDTLLAGVLSTTDLPVLVKLTPRAGLDSQVSAAAAGGADAVVIGHGWPALVAPAVRPVEALSRSMRLAGPAIRHLTLAVVAAVTRAGEVDIIACGGVVTVDDVRSYLAVGARAVQVGSASLRDPSLAARIAAEWPPAP